MATVIPARSTVVSRAGVWDGVFIGLSIAHAVVLFVAQVASTFSGIAHSSLTSGRRSDRVSTPRDWPSRIATR